MDDKLKIAGYCRISVDEEMDRDNTSIEKQKAIIAYYITKTFPTAELDFYSRSFFYSCLYIFPL